MSQEVSFRLISIEDDTDVTDILELTNEWDLDWDREFSETSEASLTVNYGRGCCPPILKGYCFRLEIFLDGRRCDSYIYKSFRHTPDGQTVFGFVSPLRVLLDRSLFRDFIRNQNGAKTFVDLITILDGSSPLGIDIQFEGSISWELQTTIFASLDAELALDRLLRNGLEYTEKATDNSPHIIYFGDLASENVQDYEISDSDFIQSPIFGGDAEIAATFVTVRSGTNGENPPNFIGHYPPITDVSTEFNNPCGFNPRRVVIDDLVSNAQAERIARYIWENSQSEFYIGSSNSDDSDGEEGELSESFGLDLCDLRPGAIIPVGDQLSCASLANLLRLGGLQFSARNGRLTSTKSVFDFVV